MSGNNPVEIVAVLRSVPSRPEPPASWAFASDTGCGWYFESEMRTRLESLGYDSNTDNYTLYVVPRSEYTPDDLAALRVSKALNDVVHKEITCDDDMLAEVREAARRRKEGAQTN